MRRLIEKVILLLLCSLSFYSCFTTSKELVYSLLITISFACFQIAISKKNAFLYLSIAFFLIGFFYPPLLLFLPVVLYDTFYIESNKHLIIGTLLFLLSLILIQTSLIELYLVIGLCSYYLAKNNRKYIDQTRTLYDLRDSSIETSRLLEQKNQIILKQQTNLIHTTTLSERNRIAREIHDNVGHMLTRSILQLGALKAMNKDEHLTPLFENLLTTLNQSMTSIRNSVHDLHDESIDLKQAINKLFETVDARFEIHFDYSMSEHVPKEIKYSFIAIVKEGLTNACKHSNGTKITIMMLEHPALYQLLIEDNGTAISSNVESGIGILNMKDRVKAMSGTFKLSTTNGFRIFISVMKEGLV